MNGVMKFKIFHISFFLVFDCWSLYVSDMFTNFKVNAEPKSKKKSRWLFLSIWFFCILSIVLLAAFNKTEIFR